MADHGELVVQVDPDGADDHDDAAALARLLRAELLDLDVAGAEPVTDDNAPGGAKGFGSVAGLLAVRLGKAALPKVLAKIRDWAGRNGRSVEVTIDGDTIKVSGASAGLQEQIAQVWLDRHASR